MDPLTRRLNLKDGNGILLTDTVGFISNLPHSLIDAFKSTLAEAEQADLQLIVIDASDSQAKFQYDTVIQVLKEIKAEQNNRLIVLNKWDAVKEKEIDRAELQLLFPDAVKVSARTHEGFDQLSERISEKLLGAMNEYEIPAEEQDILRQIRANGVISEENWLDSSVVLKARISGRTAAIAEKYRKLNSGETDAE